MRFDLKHRANISKAQNTPEYKEKRLKDFTCLGCGETKRGYGNKLYCDNLCRYKAATKDPYEGKALRLSSTVTFGKGKKEFFVSLVKEAELKPCPYCRQLLSLDIMSLDHKQPVLGNANRKLRPLNAAVNLHIVCKACNTLKNDMSDAEFRTLLQFMDNHPFLGAKLRRRLGRADILWSFKRK